MSRELEAAFKRIAKEIAWQLYAIACEHIPAWLEVLILMCLLALVGYGFLLWRDWDLTSRSTSWRYPPE